MVSGWFLLSVGELRVVKFNWDLDAISSKLIEDVFATGGEAPTSVCEYNNVSDETTMTGYITSITRESLRARLSPQGTDIGMRAISSCLRCSTRQLLCLSIRMKRGTRPRRENVPGLSFL